MSAGTPRVSVVLCTAGRPQAVARALRSLREQELHGGTFEVVVVADAEDDPAREVVRSLEGSLAARFSAQRGAGIASARNHGVAQASGELVLFLDDREVADPGLLAAHLEAHQGVAPATAVLGTTRLSPELARDPLLHYARETGCFLFSYPYAREGEPLDFTFFWPGRCSVPRALLVASPFDARFRVGDDHLELGFRLSAQGFQVVHAPRAATTLVEGFDFDAFCAWLRDQGRSRYLLARLHPERAAQEAAGIEAAREGWARVGAGREGILRGARSLDAVARASMEAGQGLSGEELALLHRSYWAAFTLSRIQGMAEQAAEEGEALARPPAAQGAPGPGGEPEVSIVIPAYNKWEYTRRCLETVARNTPAGRYEIVVVDNASSDETAEGLRSQPPPVRVLTNAVNTGFVGACNRGASAARGKWILFLNNDTEPRPGWLEPLIALAESSPEVGAVGSKLVFGNGQLQEAGGIVFRDGSGWNFGRGDVPGRPAYGEVYEVDYISGAALMVRRELFERLGGFDPRFSPGYYEDTDLCFAIRALGYKVLFCPGSVVVHFEGITNGTDTASGMKRYQVLNRAKFISKWREALARHEPNPDVTGRRPTTADRARRLAAALVDRSSPALRKIAVG